MKKILVLLLAFCMVFAFCSCRSENIHSSPEAVTKAYMESFEKRDVNTLVEAMAPFIIKDLMNDMGLKSKQELVDFLAKEQAEEGFEMPFYVTGYKQSEASGLHLMDELLEMVDLENDDGMSASDIASISDIAIVEMSIKSKEEAIEFTSTCAYCVKIDSKWYLAAAGDVY